MMKSYKDFEKFLESVDSKDIRMVKLEIINMFIILRGNRTKVNEAIDYAIDRGGLFYEEHKLSPSFDWIKSDMDKYTFESVYLEDNFSKERVLKVFELYDVAYKEEVVIKDAKQNSPIKKDNLSSSPQISIAPTSNYKTIVIVTGVLLTTYILYKILSNNE